MLQAPAIHLPTVYPGGKASRVFRLTLAANLFSERDLHFKTVNPKRLETILDLRESK